MARTKQIHNNTKHTERYVGRLALCTHRLLLQNEACNIKTNKLYTVSTIMNTIGMKVTILYIKLFQIEF